MSKVLSAFAVAAGLTVYAGQADAQTLNIENAVVRVIYRAQERDDFVVSVTETGTSALPSVQISRSGRDVTINGGLQNKQSRLIFRQCRNGNEDTPPTSPGQGGSATVDRYGRINAEDAPLLIITGPKDVKIKAEGAVFGTVTRGLEELELDLAGCGSWVVANTSEKIDVNIAGNGLVWTGSVPDLDVSIAGSGRVRATSVGQLDVRIGGTGSVQIDEVSDDVDVAIAGSGSVLIRSGNAAQLNASITGVGTIRHEGSARNLDAKIIGAGTVDVRTVTGNINRSILGGGRIEVRN